MKNFGKMIAIFMAVLTFIGCKPIGEVIEKAGITKIESHHEEMLEETIKEDTTALENFFETMPDHLQMTLEKGIVKVEIDAPVIIETDTLYTGRIAKKGYDTDKVLAACFGEDAAKAELLTEESEDHAYTERKSYGIPDEDNMLWSFVEEGASFNTMADGTNALAVVDIYGTDIYYTNYYIDLSTISTPGFYSPNELPNCEMTEEEAIETAKKFLEDIGADTTRWTAEAYAMGPDLEYGNPKTKRPSYYDVKFYCLLDNAAVKGGFYRASVSVTDMGIASANMNFLAEVIPEEEITEIIPLESALKLAENKFEKLVNGVRQKERLSDIRFAEKKIVEIRFEYYAERGDSFIPTWYFVEETSLERDKTWKMPERFDFRIDARNGEILDLIIV